MRSIGAPVLLALSLLIGVFPTTASADVVDAPYWAWGVNDEGQLGLGNTASPVTSPTAGTGPSLTQLVAGLRHACGLTSAGAASCWGRNANGQLGTGDNTSSSSPRAVAGGLTFASISAGSDHTCGLTAAGDLYCWGLNDKGQLGLPKGVNYNSPQLVGGTYSQVSAGGANTCALDTNGSAWCWGANVSGQIGNGTKGSDVEIPTAVTMPTGVTFTSISSGYFFQCALTGTGLAYCWGSNSYGRLGLNDTHSRNVPTLVSTPSFTSISSGTSHTCGISVDAGTYCWGRNNHGQLGLGNNTEKLVPTLIPDVAFTSISAYEDHTCALTGSGHGWCWGENNQGQLGLGTIVTPQTSPAEVLGGQRFSALAIGQQARYFTLAVPLRPASGDQVPTAPMQQFARDESGTCEVQPEDLGDFPALGESVRDIGWGPSWAQWPNGGTGGFVCTRQPYYTSIDTWSVR